MSAILAVVIAAPLLAVMWLRRRVRAARWGQRLAWRLWDIERRQPPPRGGFDA